MNLPVCPFFLRGYTRLLILRFGRSPSAYSDAGNGTGHPAISGETSYPDTIKFID
jgi:hypothetical protein